MLYNKDIDKKQIFTQVKQMVVAGSIKNNSKEIKSALKQEFPDTKFSVTFKRSYGYTVKWESDIADGVTKENVEAIADHWDTMQNMSNNTYVYSDYQGNSVRYEMEIVNPEWKGFVVSLIQNNYADCHFDQDKDCFYYESSGQRHHHANKDYCDWSVNGIKTNLEDEQAKWDKDWYYKSREAEKAKENKAVEEVTAIKDQTTKPSLIEQFYKHHVQNLIDCDRLDKIQPFDQWKTENEQEILKNEYKNFVVNCLQSEQIKEVQSFEDWLLA